MADDRETGAFSELTIGIRELFRIVVPGGYAVVIFEWLTAGKCDPITGEGQSVSRSAISVIAGLVAYGLLVHEKLWPYSDVFEDSPKRLNPPLSSFAWGEAAHFRMRTATRTA